MSNLDVQKLVFIFHIVNQAQKILLRCKKRPLQIFNISTLSTTLHWIEFNITFPNEIEPLENIQISLTDRFPESNFNPTNPHGTVVERVEILKIWKGLFLHLNRMFWAQLTIWNMKKVFEHPNCSDITFYSAWLGFYKVILRSNFVFWNNEK